MGYATVVKKMSGRERLTCSIVASMSGSLLAFVAPHQEHPTLNAARTAQFDRLLHLLNLDAAFHRVKNALRAAL